MRGASSSGVCAGGVGVVQVSGGGGGVLHEMVSDRCTVYDGCLTLLHP